MSGLDDVLRQAAEHLSSEHAAAIDLYIMEEGPLKIEYVAGESRFVVKQHVRLRMKDADEIRNDALSRAAEKVAALTVYLPDQDGFMFDTVVQPVGDVWLRRTDVLDALGWEPELERLRRLT